MNRIYRLVWNRAKRVMQVTSELAGSGAHGGGATGAGARYRPGHALLALACALALPSASAWAAAPTVDTTQPFYDQFSAALLQNPVVFEGGTFKPTTGFNLSTPVTLDTPGGFIDATNGNVYLNGAVSGPGGLTITAGGVALTTANTYSGGTTINSGAVLGIQNTLAALPGNVVDNGYLQLEATTGTYAGTISGLGGVQVVSLGGGTLVLTGNHTAAGPLFIYDGTVQLGAGGTTGSWGGSSIGIASSLVFNRSDTLTYGGLISDFNGGSGSLTQTGTGTLVLTGNNTYTGGTTISAGTLQIGNGGATGAVTGNVVDNGTLVFDRSGTLALSGVISGTGSVQQVGSGTTALTNANAYTGGTTISAGTLQVTDASSLGTGTITINNARLTSTSSLSTNNAININGNVTISAAGNLAPSGGISGSGNLTMNSGTFSAGGDVTINGPLSVTTTAGSITQAASVFTVGGTSTFNAGNNAITLTSTNAFGGTVNLTGGATQITNGGNLTLGTLNTGALTAVSTFGALNLGSGTVAGALTATSNGLLNESGSGLNVTGPTSFTQNGSGANVDLSGANDFHGGVTISGASINNLSLTNTDATPGTLTLPASVTGNLTLNYTNAALTVPVVGVGGALNVSAANGITINGNVNTGGRQTYNNAVTLGADATLASTGNGAIDFVSTVDGAYNLTVNTGGVTTFGGAVGGTTALTSLTTGAAGSTTLGGNVTTTGAQTYNDAVTLSGDATLTSTGGGAIDLASTVNGTHHLSVSTGGAATFGGAVGGGTPLTGLTTNSGTFSANALTIGSGGLSVTTTAGSITQGGAFNVTGASSFNAGANAITLANAGNAFTGAVSLTGGNVSLLNSTATTLGAGTVSGTLTVSSSGALTQTGAITVGTLTGSSAGDTTLTAANQIGTLGAFNAGGNFSLANTQALLIGGALSAANVALNDNAGITVTGAIHATGSTTIGNGTSLQIGNGGGSGSITGNVLDNGALVFNQNSTGTFAGVISGSGSLTQNGTGVLTLSGANTYGGGTTISAGTVQGDTTSLQGNIANNATLVFNQTTAGTFAGAISGSGALLQQGSSTLTLDGNSSGFTGSTDVQSGSLIVGSLAGNGAALGGNVVVDSGATLGGHGTIGGNVDVASGAHLAPGNSIGTLTISGNASFAQGSVLDYEFGAPGANFQAAGSGDSVKVGGSLTLNGTVLNVTDAGGFGPGLYNLFTYGGTLTETNGGITLGAIPAGDALVIQNLTANKQINLLNTTGLTLSLWNGNGLASTTQMGGGSGTWTTTSPNWTDATGNVSAAMQPQPGFAIFGGATAGTVTVDNSAGNVSATGMQFASNGYTLTGGTLSLVGSGAAPIIRVGDGSSAGAGYTATINNVIAGSDGLTKSDLGTLVLTGANTYSGATTINGGALSVASDASLGAATNALTLDGGTLQVTGTTFNATSRDIALGSAGVGFDIADAGNTFTVAQTLGGSGGLSKLGAGTLVLSGTNSYSGGTTISTGTLQGDTTSLQGNISNNATLVFNQTTAGIFTGVLSGNGTLSKTGAGTLTFNGSSPFGGATTVTSGRLVVGDDSHTGASLGGTVTVASGATLGGIGTIGGLNLVGTVTPGNSIGTLHVAGDATFQQGSSYQIEAAPNGSSDQIAATGKVTILGGSAVVLAQAGNWAPRTDYTIITGAQGVSGQFASASSSLLFLNPVLSYTANAVNLSLQRNDINFASVAQTPNQLAVATVTNGLGFVSPMYSALTTLDAPTARHAFDQLSGEIHASTSTALVDDSRYVREAINRHLLSLNDGTEDTTAQGVSVWTSAWGHGGHHDDDGNAASLQANGGGLLVGADLFLDSNSRLGAVVGHGQNSIRENSLGSSAHVLGDHVGLYGSSSFGAFVLRGGIAYARQDVHSNRAVAFGSYSDWLSSEHHAQTAQAYVEGGYQFNMSPGQQLEPFVNVARVRVHSDALQEGGGNAALAGAGNSVSVNTATLGLRDTLTLDAAGGIHAHASLGYQQAWGDLTPVTTMRFVTGGNSFAVAGMPVARHALTTDLGIDFKLAKNVNVDASYLGQFASGVHDQGARMSLSVTF